MPLWFLEISDMTGAGGLSTGWAQLTDSAPTLSIPTAGIWAFICLQGVNRPQTIRYSQSRPSNVRVTGSPGSPFSRLAICEINFVCLVGSRPSDQDQSQDYTYR
jgi:hypothetical protein